VKSTKKVKVALVGMGRMGKNHLRVIRENASFELVAVVDKDAPEQDLGATKFLRKVSDLQPLDFECAVVAAPTVTHYDIAKELLEMGKHLLVEKPITSTAPQGREVIALAQKKNLKLAVGHVERFNPAVRKLREVIKGGWLGTPIHFSVTRVGGYPQTVLNGNNVLLDLAVHDVDVLRSMIGTLRMESCVSHSTVNTDVPDTAEILLRGANGMSATVHVNWITPTKIRSIRVTGTRGVCFVDYILQTCELLGGSLSALQQAPSETGFGTLQELYKTIDRIEFGVLKEEPLKVQLQQFYSLITTGEPGELCLGRDALAAVMLVERAWMSGAEKAKPGPATSEAELPQDTDAWV
jgi:UDP-N-acetylglucosamine 3-dehydrogenase